MWADLRGGIRRNSVPGSPDWGLGLGLTFLPRKNKPVTETTTTTNIVIIYGDEEDKKKNHFKCVCHCRNCVSQHEMFLW